MKYQSCSTHCWKVISKVKVFKIWVKLQGQGHKVKNNGTHRKVLSKGILMWNIKALAHTVQKLLARLEFQNYRRTDRTKAIWSTKIENMEILNTIIFLIRQVIFFPTTCWKRLQNGIEKRKTAIFFIQKLTKILNFQNWQYIMWNIVCPNEIVDYNTSHDSKS